MHHGNLHDSNKTSNPSIILDEDELTDCDPELKNITKFMGAFFVHLDRVPAQSSRRVRRLKDLIFVFKKKRLPLKAFESKTDIYALGLRGLELDMSNQNKSRSSCMRCRRNRRKCTRDLPECMNCGISEELCVYEPRKKRRYTHAGETADIIVGLEPCQADSIDMAQGMYLMQGQPEEIVAHEENTACPRGSDMHVTISTETEKLRDSALHSVRAKPSSDLMRLLN